MPYCRDVMEIKPFKAFRYDQAVVGDVGSCIAPPYDVISAAQQQRLYEKNEHNIIRVIKGKTSPSDNDRNNQYTRAAESLNGWIEKGALKQDTKENIYAYVQDFDLNGMRLQRFSFIASARLEQFGRIVRPHEQIMEEPMADRLKLKKTTGAQFGLVFMLYEDPENIAERVIESAMAGKPLIDHTDENNVRHRIFAVSEHSDIEVIEKMMQDKSCIIADGHHRYTTALAYAKENPNPAARYLMCAFANTCHEGLVILATHRLVGNINEFEFEKFIAQLRTDFELAEFGFDSPQNKFEALQKMLATNKVTCDQGKTGFGIYGGTNSFYLAVLKNKRAMDSLATDKSNAWRTLDVSVLHKLVLEQLLALDESANLKYVKGRPDAIDEMLTAVDKANMQIAFFMNPVTAEQLKAVTDAGERMPQKSTYFYPKVYTGLTISKL